MKMYVLAFLLASPNAHSPLVVKGFIHSFTKHLCSTVRGVGTLSKVVLRISLKDIIQDI